MRSIREELDNLQPLGDIDAALRDSNRGPRRPGWLRTGGVLVATAAAVATIAAGTSLLLGSDSTSELSTSAGDPGERQAADPDTIQAALLNAVDAAAPGNPVWKNSTVAALDAQNTPVAGAARKDATRWKGTFQANDREELSLILIKEQPMTADQARSDCAKRLELGHAATCEVSLDGDAVVQQITRGAHEDPDGWPVVLTKDFASKGANLWLMQQTILRNPSGTTVYVAEVANAPTWEQAAEIWVLDPAALPRLAAKINLPLG